MKKARNENKVSRRHLADPKLGMSYKERLNQTKIIVRSGAFKIEECGNGYARISKLSLSTTQDALH